MFLVYILFGEFLCSISINNVSKTKKKKINKKITQKINKIKTPVNFSFAACGMEKLKIRVEYVIFCVLLVIGEKGL